MSRFDSLGDRMKSYENVTRNKLIRRMPVIIRLDGKAFHTYTKGCHKPFDLDLHTVRRETLKYLCENIQGCIIGYSQSDEISLVLKDWQSYNTSAWFDNNIQKIVSVSASMCTAVWNQHIYGLSLHGKFNKMAMFDSRAFNVAKEEVINYLIWRQQDWERNSKQMLARSFYSDKQCHKKSCQQLITMVEEDYGIIWGELPDWQKQGEIWVEGKLMDNYIFNHHRNRINYILEETND